jgi:predicted AAA+ superfamily ATPase
LADHDARELHAGGYANQLHTLLAMIASQGQTELVKVKLARALGVSETTLDSYLRLARTMRLTVEFPAWTRAPRGRVVRRPKACLVDTGLSAALAKFTVAKALTPGGREFYGTLVEQFAALELAKQRRWSATAYDLFHFRDPDGLEVDLVAETDDNDLIAIEIKSTQSVTTKSWANLIGFQQRFNDRRVTGVLLHGGDYFACLQGWLWVLPLTALWQH